MNEFELIQKYFKPLTSRCNVLFCQANCLYKCNYGYNLFHNPCLRTCNEKCKKDNYDNGYGGYLVPYKEFTNNLGYLGSVQS